ncbi:MAG: glycosyl hydrolase [Mangrovibacterium sp.]
MCLLMISISSTDQTNPKSLDPLETLFLYPPSSAKPYVWWHWMGTNFSRAGITKDLEAMKDAGIGGATIFNLSSKIHEPHATSLNEPWPEQTYRSPAYWDAIRFAAAEAQRFGTGNRAAQHRGLRYNRRSVD